MDRPLIISPFYPYNTHPHLLPHRDWTGLYDWTYATTEPEVAVHKRELSLNRSKSTVRP